MINEMDLEYLLGLMGADMKASGRMGNSMAKENI